MRVLVEEHHDLPLVVMDIMVRTGPASDPVGLEGLSRHASELMRRGAGGLDREALDAAFDALGASVELGISYDTITLEIQCLARHVDRVADLAAGVLARPLLDLDEHERLRREELASLDEVRDDDPSLASRFFDRAALAGHAYGRSSMGTEASIARLTRDHAAEWVSRFVVRDNLAVGFAGDLTEARALALAARMTDALAVGEPAEATFGAPAAGGARRTILIDKPDRAQSQIIVGHAAPAPAHPDFMALQVAAAAFGGTFTSRLMTEVRVKRGWSYGASFRTVRARAGHSFRMRVFPSAEQTPDTLALILSLWEDAVRAGLSDDEIAFVKSYLEGSWAFEIDTAGERLDRRLELLAWGLPADALATHVERLRAVGAAEVNAALRRHWHPESAAIAVTGTAETLAPRLAGLAIGALEILPFDSY